MPAGGFQGQMFEEQDQYIQERSNAMAQVESTIVELGDMFTQLATMVQGLFLGCQGYSDLAEDSVLNFKFKF